MSTILSTSSSTCSLARNSDSHPRHGKTTLSRPSNATDYSCMDINNNNCNFCFKMFFPIPEGGSHILFSQKIHHDTVIASRLNHIIINYHLCVVFIFHLWWHIPYIQNFIYIPPTFFTSNLFIYIVMKFGKPAIKFSRWLQSIVFFMTKYPNKQIMPAPMTQFFPHV